MCAWIWFSEIKYSQLKINHLNDTPSTKAAGGRIYSGVLLKDVKVPVKVRRTLSSVGTSSSNSFFIVAGNRSQNENMFLQINLIGLLYYDLLANVCIS